MPDFAFDPLLSMPLIAALATLAILAAILSALGRLRSLIARLFAALMLILALLNPQKVEEERDPLPDEVLILKDNSDSVRLGQRGQIMDNMYKEFINKLEQDPNLEISTALIPTDIDGTRIMSTLIENLGQMPQSRLAGVILLSDGQIHDVLDNPASILPDNVPFHSLIIDDPTLRDRSICLLYTSPSPRDKRQSRMPSSA